MEAKSVSDLSKKDTIITTLETASYSFLIWLNFAVTVLYVALYRFHYTYTWL